MTIQQARLLRGTAAAILAATFIVAAQHADAQRNGLVYVNGEATVEATPEHVDFWLHWHRTGDTLAELAEESNGLEETVVEALNSRDLAPRETQVGTLKILNVQEPEAGRTIRLRFQAYTFLQRDEGPANLASVSDALRAIAADLGCHVEGPKFGLRNPTPVEQTAIARALENAYPPSEGAAQTLQTRIVAIESVEVLDIDWLQSAYLDEDEGLRGPLAVRVRVGVAYAMDDT